MGSKEFSAQQHNHIQDSLIKYLTQTYFYHLVTGTEDGFHFDKCIYSIINQFYFLKGVWNKVSAVKHNHMKDSLKKYFTKTKFIHFVTGTEDGSMHDTIVSSFDNASYFLGGWNEVSVDKNNHYGTSKKSVDKTKYEYHIVTGTEAGFICYTIGCPFITLIICLVIILFLSKVIIIGRIAKMIYALICIYIIF